MKPAAWKRLAIHMRTELCSLSVPVLLLANKIDARAVLEA